MKKFVFLAALVSLLAACSADVPPITGCDAQGDIKVFCDMKSPEDISALPDGKHLLLAHFGGMKEGDGSGSISLFDTDTEKRTPLYPASAPNSESAKADWGDGSCATPPNATFSPHGAHLQRLASGEWRYLVVNHGDREAVELFQLNFDSDKPEQKMSLTWRGCVVAADDTIMNDVVGFANGDLIYSRMFHRSDSNALLKSLVGMNTGELWRWNKQSGLKPLSETEAAQPNGLELSADEKYVFADMYMEKEVWKIDAKTGEVVAVGDVAYADNSAWGPDGRLWIATHNGGIGEMKACFENQDKPCGASFEIIAMDPKTMETEVVFAHRGAPMGVATIAVPQNGRVYMGSFAGDRMISVPAFGGAG